MKRFLILTLMLCGISAAPVTAGESKTYGDGVTLDEAVAIDTLLANPNDYVGRKIRVDGVITDYPDRLLEVLGRAEPR